VRAQVSGFPYPPAWGCQLVCDPWMTPNMYHSSTNHHGWAISHALQSNTYLLSITFVS
jgi:hypothetical protein